MFFKEDYIKYNRYLENENSIFIKGINKPRFRDADLFEFKINSIQLLSSIREQEAKNVGVQVDMKAIDNSIIQAIKDICMKHPGKVPLKVKVLDYDEQYSVLLKSNLTIEPSNELLSNLKQLPVVGVKLNES
jgi:DNA polymerase-3 subunit alpha